MTVQRAKRAPLLERAATHAHPVNSLLQRFQFVNIAVLESTQAAPCQRLAIYVQLAATVQVAAFAQSVALDFLMLIVILAQTVPSALAEDISQMLV
jgi:hypothetical protein